MIKPLTSFRFIAAVAVFFSHLSLLSTFNETKSLYNFVFYEGYIGVTFFFILSGFILAYNYHDKFNRLDISRYLKFYRARFSRIYPVHLLTFMIAIPLYFTYFHANPGRTVLQGLLNILLLQSFIPINDFYFSFNSPSWSISTEMFFYMWLPFILWSMIAFFKKTRNQILIGIPVILWVIGICSAFLFRDHPLSHWLFYVFPLFRMLDFVIGVCLGLLFINMKTTKLSFRFFSIMEFVSVALLILGFSMHSMIHQTLRLWGYYEPFMAVIILIFAFQNGILSKCLTNKLFVLLGEISFSFYMLHQLIIKYLLNFPALAKSPYEFAITAFIISLTGSYLIYTYYEIPLRDRIRKIEIPNPLIKKLSIEKHRQMVDRHGG